MSSVADLLKHPQIKTQNELKRFIRNVQTEIGKLEKGLYEEYSEEMRAEIKGYRRRLMEIINEHRNVSEDDVEKDIQNLGDDSSVSVETLRLLNRQLEQAGANQRILESGTLKLIGLDYTNNDIEEAIKKAGDNLNRSKRLEAVEIRNIRIGFVVFISVCVLIVVDKVLRK